jgi:hypothetical protein
MPIDARSVQVGDVEFIAERHVSHFATCPQADKWRRPR